MEPVVTAPVPVLVQPPPNTVPGAPRGPLAQAKGPEPISLLFATASAPRPERKDGSTLHCGKPLPEPGFEIEVSVHAPAAPIVFQMCWGTMGTPPISSNAKALTHFNAMYRDSC